MGEWIPLHLPNKCHLQLKYHLLRELFLAWFSLLPCLGLKHGASEWCDESREWKLVVTLAQAEYKYERNFLEEKYCIPRLNVNGIISRVCA